MIRFLFIAVALGIFLIGCSSAGNVPAAAPTAPSPPTAFPTVTPISTVPAPTVFAALATARSRIAIPTVPDPTVAPPTLAPLVAIPIQTPPPFPDGGFVDESDFLQWLIDLPETLVCTEETIDDGGRLITNIACLSRTDDFQIITETLLQGFPGRGFTVQVVMPMSVAVGQAAQMQCYTPSRISPNGSCYVEGSAYGNFRVLPRIEE